jgi:hypothetical protein
VQKWEHMKITVKWTYTEDGWQFQYENKHYSADDIISVMNVLGQQGWEHTGVMPFHTTIHTRSPEEEWIETSTDKYDLFFKRRVEEG